MSPANGGYGDLRSLSRRPWSKSADDLSKMSTNGSTPTLTPIDTSLHQKIKTYRSDSVSSSAATSSPIPSPSTASFKMKYPFPVVSAELSTSPPKNARLAPLPPSNYGPPISPPLTPSSSTSTTTSHVHSRSHSFTPRLPSKLSTPKVSGLMPPSPKRKGSASSERGDPDRDKSSTGSGTSGRSPFPFGFGGGSTPKIMPPPLTISSDGSHSSQGPSSPTFLAPPPLIVEPGPGGDDAGKRSSQMVHQSGFINRMSDFSPEMLGSRAHHAYMTGQSQAVLTKGWKPFKLVLKGSKLYFYKPPSDRGAGIRELFPTELVADIPDAEEDPDMSMGVDMQDSEMDMGGRGGGGKGKERDELRRRRAYWGRGTHPALVIVDGEVQKGSTEAIVHEAVFATTFVVPSPDGSGLGSDSSVRYKLEWREFASGIILCLPTLVGRAVFETEFCRCCTNLLGGAEDDVKEEELERVRWLASKYLNYHRSPANQETWDSWCKDTIPDFSPSASPIPNSVSQSLSTEPSQASLTGLGTEMHPRPHDSKMQSIIEALGETNLQPAPAPPPSLSPKSLRKALEDEGLSRDVLLNLDPALVARSLFLRQRPALQKILGNFAADYVLSVGSQEPGDPSPLRPFLGSDEQPHWLTRIVLIQVLVPEPAGAASSNHVNGQHPAASRAHSRSEVISAWAKVGEASRRAGDDCSWRAIMAALCSRPIARLDKVWKRVDPEALSAVQAWAHIVVRRDQSADVPTAPLVYPWAGDAERDVREALEKARCGEGEEWAVGCLRSVQERFDDLRTTFASCTQRCEADAAVSVSEAPAVDVLVKHWNTLTADTESRGLASKFLRVEQFMSLSNAAEPRRRGLFEPYFWSRISQQPSAHPLAALLFPDPLPTICFINRAQIVRGRLESNASLHAPFSAQDIRSLRLLADGDRTIRMDRPKLNGLDLGGTTIPVYNGELLLLVQPGGDPVISSRPTSRAPSRPPSRSTCDSPIVGRNPSIRVTPSSSHGHGTAERKSSLARRNSLPSLSQRTSLVASEITSERPLRVVVQAGTLERLVDVLVHGLQGVSVSVADDNGEMPLTDRKTREVRVDMDDFSQVWWSVFRSFVSTQVLFELLRKRYVGAQQPGRALTPDEISHVLRLRLEVLDTLNEWINLGGGAQDALDDGALYEAILAFLTQPTEWRLSGPAPEAEASASQAAKALEASRTALLTCFRSQTLRPVPRTPAIPEPTNDGASIQSYTSELPDLDQVGAEELVNNLNAMASATFRNVTQEDLFIIADLFELQSADRTGWYLNRDPSSIADEVEIQSMSSYVLEVEPSPLISELAQDNLYRLLPLSVRSCIRAFGILRKWLMSRIVASNLGIWARQQRMELMLRAIEVARLRNADSESTQVPLSERPCVRSFVEAIITSVVLSVESRTYQRAWLGVAIARGTGCDTLAAYFARPTVTSMSTRGTLTADMGWLMERVLEIISLPDVLESSPAEKTVLVNFEKRRSLQSLLANASGTGSARKQRRREADRREFERLSTIEKEVATIHFDLRAIREDAHREAMQASVSNSKRGHRPFQQLVAQQQEKNRRDRLMRDRLSKEKRQEQQRHDKREEQLNRAMNQRRQNPVMPKQHRNKKSMSSAFFQLMRPISSAFTSDSTPGGSPSKRTPAELDFVPSHKPSQVLSVVNAHVAHFVNNERSFVFQLNAEDGGHYLLQATSRQEMKKWIETIERVSKMTAKRRLTYLGGSVKLQMTDDLLARPAVATRDPVAVFGVELEFLLQREATGGDVQPGAIPSVVERLIDEVESRGLMEVGIYRIAGAHSEVNALRDALNRGEWPISEITDIHAVCDLIKSWFRVLPGGLFPPELYGRILGVTRREDVDFETKVSNVRDIVHALPAANFDILKRIIEHLEKVTDYEDSNQMTTESLSTVFAPNLLRSTNSDVGNFFSNMAACHRVTKILISHFHSIFDNDAEREQEAEAELEEPVEEPEEMEEMELEEPIPEEDEEDEEELFREADMPKLPSEPPILNINFSPASLTFNIP
ncbi:transporter [Ganoderma sinense ZZ0214-1]|uniref:Transporter n=1 Tax=Ganoderma sinense ZZ0214-1 TaxID=1077348 RepID=A0A2G8SJ16_9APHY|nr:transporter [Ganoderma sinense ZZ0214-1]